MYPQKKSCRPALLIILILILILLYIYTNRKNFENTLSSKRATTRRDRVVSFLNEELVLFEHKQKQLFISYSQILEDLILYNVFDSVSSGFYVDVGANDPITDSVTKILYLNGWRGINIEPLPRHCQSLADDRPRDINLCFAVGDKEATMTLYEHNFDQLTTFKEEVVKKWKNGTFTQRAIPVIPLTKVLDQYCERNQTIQFIKIDVEGFEREVLLGTDFQKYRPQVLVLEWGISTNFEDILNINKYRLGFQYKWNRYYYDANLPDLKNKFRTLKELFQNYSVAKLQNE